MHKGSCLCGKISYEINGKLSEFGYCHCTSCRKASGSSHGANVGVARQDFTLLDAEQRLSEYESSPGKYRSFCSNCGSPIYAYLAENKSTIRIRLGSLDSEFTGQAKAHTFVADKAAWDKIEGELPQFEAWADAHVLVQAGSKQP